METNAIAIINKKLVNRTVPLKTHSLQERERKINQLDK